MKIRVLSSPANLPEVESSNALMRMLPFTASTWLQTADPNYDQLGNPAPRRPTTDK